MKYQAVLTLTSEGQSTRIAKNIVDDVLSWDTEKLVRLFDVEIERVAGRKQSHGRSTESREGSGS